MVTLDPIIPLIVTVAFTIFALSFILRYFNIPSVITYIIVGVILGPHLFGAITDVGSIEMLGNLGVILLLFFIGMEVSLNKLLKNWKIAFLGTLFQVCLSVFVIYLIGLYLDWPLQRAILIGFVISLSSTAVVIKILEANNEIKSKISDNLIGILLVQDIMAIPMIIILSIFSADTSNPSQIPLQIIGMILMITVMFFLAKKKNLKLPFLNTVKQDHELQIFTALGICFGFALLSSLFGISSALGSFLAGMIVASIKEIKFFQESLSSFYVVFVAIFFLSIGLIIDINFLFENWKIIMVLTLLAMFLNLIINTVILKFLGLNLKESIYSALLLSHIGEFSYVLIAIGFSENIIAEYTYNLAIIIISMSLLISPLLISLYKMTLKSFNVKTSF